MDLSGLDFFREIFAGTERQLLPLHNSHWHRSRLLQSEFGNVDLTGADFSGIEGRMSHWLGCRLPGAHFEGADLQGSLWRNLNLPDGLLHNSNMRDATAIECHVNGSPWRPTRKIDARPCWAVSKKGGWVTAVALGRAGDREVVAAGGGDGSVRLWDAVSGAELAVLGGLGGWVNAVALGRAGDRDFILSLNADGAARLTDIGAATFKPGRTLILGPGPGTLLDLIPDGEGGYRLARLSDDAWRYWRAQGFAENRLVNFPIDDMPRAT